MKEPTSVNYSTPVCDAENVTFNLIDLGLRILKQLKEEVSHFLFIWWVFFNIFLINVLTMYPPIYSIAAFSSAVISGISGSIVVDFCIAD